MTQTPMLLCTRPETPVTGQIPITVQVIVTFACSTLWMNLYKLLLYLVCLIYPHRNACFYRVSVTLHLHTLQKIIGLLHTWVPLFQELDLYRLVLRRIEYTRINVHILLNYAPCAYCLLLGRIHSFLIYRQSIIFHIQPLCAYYFINIPHIELVYSSHNLVFLPLL